MKKLLLFIVMLISVNASSQWTWQNPKTTLFNLNSASFVNSQTGWAVGLKGSLMKTTNGGNNWKYINVDSQSDFQAVRFFNASTGYITGSNYDSIILKSTNGGSNWFSVPVPATFILRSFFLNENTGWVGTYYGIILKTTDGCASWTQKQVLSTMVHDIYFLNSSTGWFVAGLGAAYKTTDGGDKWEFQKTGSAYNLNSVYFRDVNTGWIAGDYGTAVYTVNGGIDWNAQTISNLMLHSVAFVNNSTGWIVGDSSTIFKSTNGGVNWLKQVNSNVYDLESVKFTGTLTGYAVGLHGAVIKTTNGGTNWVNQAYSTESYLQSVHFANNYTGWTVGTEGTIMKSTNSGMRWVQQQSGADFTYRGVRAVSSNNAWVVGDNGKIIRTINGGYSWSTQQSGTSQNLNSVFFINSSTGWIAGDSGIILKTTNRGTNWFIKTGIDKKQGKCVYFIDSNTGWLACLDLYKTTDGGETWKLKSTANAYSVHFVNSLTGYIVGGTYLFDKSTDGGETWVSVTDSFSNDVNADSPPATFTSVFFLNESTGWYTENHSLGCRVIGWNTPGISTEHNNLRCVYGNQSGFAWAVGEYGTIVSTTNGGLTFNNGNVYETPLSYSLSQNYPNPFNPLTKIKYEVPKLSDVKIVVYDVMGREVRTLMNEKMKAGTYEVIFDASMLSSGVYFYRIQSHDFSETKRMLFIK